MTQMDLVPIRHQWIQSFHPGNSTKQFRSWRSFGLFHQVPQKRPQVIAHYHLPENTQTHAHQHTAEVMPIPLVTLTPKMESPMRSAETWTSSITRFQSLNGRSGQPISPMNRCLCDEHEAEEMQCSIDEDGAVVRKRSSPTDEAAVMQRYSHEVMQRSSEDDEDDHHHPEEKIFMDPGPEDHKEEITQMVKAYFNHAPRVESDRPRRPKRSFRRSGGEDPREELYSPIKRKPEENSTL